MLIVGDFDFLKSINTDLDIYENVRKEINYSWNVILDPNKTHTLSACCKRIPEWIYASPEAIMILFSAHNIRNIDKVKDEKAYIDMLQYKMEYILWKLHAHLKTNISIILPNDKSAARFSKSDTQIICNVFNTAQIRIRHVADKTGSDIIDLSSHEQLNIVKELPFAVKSWLMKQQ